MGSCLSVPALGVPTGKAHYRFKSGGKMLPVVVTEQSVRKGDALA